MILIDSDLYISIITIRNLNHYLTKIMGTKSYLLTLFHPTSTKKNFFWAVIVDQMQSWHFMTSPISMGISNLENFETRRCRECVQKSIEMEPLHKGKDTWWPYRPIYYIRTDR